MIQRTDQFGFPIRIASDDALLKWNATVHAFLSHAAATPDHLAATLVADPEFARGFLAKGFFCQLLGRGEMRAVARDALDTATDIGERVGTDPVDRVLTDALRDLIDGQGHAAADRLDALLPQRPTDAFLAKLVHAIRFVIGDVVGMRASLEGVIDAYSNETPGAGYMLGCHAFALEETGSFAEAERTGRKALMLAPDDAWGLHAVAHVHEMCGRAADGIGWLENRTDGWRHCNNFRYHVWWHLALFYLDRGDFDAVFALYDREIRPVHSDDYRDVSNAASLLARLELEGADVGDRWDELATISEHRIDDQSLAFADLHYMLALLGGDRIEAAGQLLSAMRVTAASGHGEISAVDRTVGVPVAAGLAAFTAGDYATATHMLAPAIADLQSVGGSHAQRDVFERIAVEAALRAGADGAVESLLEHRASRRGGADAFSQSRMATLTALRARSPLARSGTQG